MNPEAVCQRFADDLLRSDPPSPELAAHLAACEACRETRQTFAEVRRADSTVPEAEVDRLTGLVLANSLPQPPTPRPPLSLPSILGGLVLGLAIGGAAWWGFHRPPATPAPTRIDLSGPAAIDRSQLVVIPQGTFELEIPDGSKARLVGKSGARVQPRGLDLYWGTAEIAIRFQEQPLTANTPHCLIAGTEGSFSCQALGTGTLIVSQDATLTVTPREGAPFTLRPGETRMVAGLPGEAPPATGPLSTVPSPDREADPR